VALAVCVVATGVLAGQSAAPKVAPADVAGFKEFTDRVQTYVALQKTLESSLPPLKSTDLPELIAAHQQALARKIKEARPRAKPGDIFTLAATEAFRRASRAALTGPQSSNSLAYMQPGAADPAMPLTVNGVYPDTASITSVPPGLLAAFPALPPEVSYRIVGRTLILMDVKSSLVIDLARLVLPAAAFPLRSNSVRLAAIGDMGTGKRLQREVAQQMVKSRTTFPFEFIITLGDNLYTGSRPADFEKGFAVPYKVLLDAGVQFYASLGNHDNTNQRFYKPFNMNGANYYTFKKGNVRFFALDSTYMDPKQTAWLEAQLRDASDGEWKVAYFHHAIYSSGRFHGSATDLRKVLEPLFVKYGVDVVFAGHEHVYERTHPQKGIYYFTEGASGKLRANNLRPSPITASGFDADCSFMTVEFAGEDMYFQATSRTGENVDSGVIHRTTGPVPAGGT